MKPSIEALLNVVPGKLALVKEEGVHSWVKASDKR